MKPNSNDQVLTKRLMVLKEKVDNSVVEKTRLEGRLEQLMETLDERYECKTIGDAKKKLQTLTNDLKKAESKLQRDLSALEEEFGELVRS